MWCNAIHNCVCSSYLVAYLPLPPDPPPLSLYPYLCLPLSLYAQQLRHHAFVFIRCGTGQGRCSWRLVTHFVCALNLNIYIFKSWLGMLSNEIFKCSPRESLLAFMRTLTNERVEFAGICGLCSCSFSMLYCSVWHVDVVCCCCF